MKTLLTPVFCIALFFCLSNCTNRNNGEISGKDSLTLKKSNELQLVDGWYKLTNDKEGVKVQLDKSDEVYYVQPTSIVSKENFKEFKISKSASNGENPDYNILLIHMDKVGTEKWATATGDNVNQYFGLVINNKLICATMIGAKMEGVITVLNRPGYTKEELEKFIDRLK